MSDATTTAALVCAAAAVASIFVGAAAWHPREGVRLALDLWLAAGLLHLSADVSWRALAIVATVVLVRKLISSGIARRQFAGA